MSTGQQKRTRHNRRKPMGTIEANAMRSAVTRSEEACETMIFQHPMSSALAAFGIGMGIGVAVGMLLWSHATPPPSFGKRAELAAEKLGRQMLDAISGVLPNSLARHA